MKEKNISTRVLPYKQLAIGMTVLGGVALALSVFTWVTVVRPQPERLFWSAVDNSMKANSVTVTSDRDVSTASDEKSASKILQFNGSHKIVKEEVTTKGNGGEANYTILSSPVKTYVNYSKIELSDTKIPADVTNRWYDLYVAPDGLDEATLAKANADGITQSESQYAELVFTILPLGLSDSRLRGELVEDIRNGVFEIDFERVAREVVDGRVIRRYPVKINVQKYSAFLLKYAEKTKAPERFRSFAKSLANAESGAFPSYLTISVDEMSQDIIKIASFIDELRDRKTYAQNFNNYNLNYNILLPSSNVEPVKVLQDKFEAVNPKAPKGTENQETQTQGGQ
jgi:hypothetical protein